MDDLQEMKQLIEQMRKKLHDSLHGRRFTDPKVLKASQAMNKVLNKYERLLKAKRKGNS